METFRFQNNLKAIGNYHMVVSINYEIPQHQQKEKSITLKVNFQIIFRKSKESQFSKVELGLVKSPRLRYERHLQAQLLKNSDEIRLVMVFLGSRVISLASPFRFSWHLNITCCQAKPRKQIKSMKEFTNLQQLIFSSCYNN